MSNLFYYFFPLALCLISINTGLAKTINAEAAHAPATIATNHYSQPNAGSPFFITESSGVIGEEVCVEVLTESFNGITGFQFTLNFNPSIIAYAGITVNDTAMPGLSLANNFNLNFAANGIITVVFFAPDGEAISLTDNTVLFDICFTALAEGASAVSFGNDPTPIVVLDGALNEIPFEGEDGHIDVQLCQDVNVTIDTTLCTGQSIEIGGVVYTIPGTYENSFTTAFGCDSTVVLNISFLGVGFNFPDTVSTCFGELTILEAPDSIITGFPSGPFGQSHHSRHRHFWNCLN
jgi:hypothetical protein